MTHDQVQHRRVRWIAGCGAILLMVVTASVPASTSPLARAVHYVVSTQAADGSFFGGAQPIASGGGLAETLVALASGNLSDAVVIDKALARFASEGSEEMTRAAYVGRAIMGLVAVGKDPRSHGGYNYDAKLDEYYNPSGYWDTQLYANALAALGEIASGDKLEVTAITWIKSNQCTNGGFGWAVGCATGADVDTTSMIINVFVAQGLPGSDLSLQRARDYLVAAENANGGFGSAAESATNANSTALALSAIAALGEDPTAAPWKVGEGKDPFQQLLGLQLPDGSFRYSASDTRSNAYATVQAIPGLAGRSYPVFPQVATPSPTSTITASPTSSPSSSPTATPSISVTPSPGVSASTTPSATASPSPSPSPSEVTVESSVDIKYRQGWLRGRVRSSLAVCRADRSIALMKVRRGPDKRVGRGTTADDGTWRVRFDSRSGSFYARARTVKRAGGITCGGTRSERLRF